MNSATMQLIIALLPAAENIVFNIGGQLVKIATSDLNTPEAVAKALEDAKAEGFPQLTFVPAAASAKSDTATSAPAVGEAAQPAAEETAGSGAPDQETESAAGTAEALL